MADDAAHHFACRHHAERADAVVAAVRPTGAADRRRRPPRPRRTWAAISRCAARDERFRGVALSRNFGHQLALTCSYDLARGDAIICMDADLQDPPEVVQKMV
ncbi:MAG: glycosyltransferase [Planctomycetes bacterium]|nr:glycosyltransferase [Planctomycetota bacterium]